MEALEGSYFEYVEFPGDITSLSRDTNIAYYLII